MFPVNDPIGAMVMGMDTSNVDSVFIRGKALKSDGRLVGLDVGGLAGRARASRDFVVSTSGFTLPEI